MIFTFFKNFIQAYNIQLYLLETEFVTLRVMPHLIKVKIVQLDTII